MPIEKWMLTRRAVLLCLACAATACSDNGTSPSPTVSNVAGQWTYTKTLTEVVYGGCVGDTLRAAIGAQETGTLSITQYDNDQLAATFTPDSGGPSCHLTGQLRNGTIALGWGYPICSPPIVPFQCTSGEVLDVHTLTRNLFATVTGRGATLEGNGGDTADVWFPGTRRYPPGEGGVRTMSSFRAVRR
jgi:hypothetical protein